MKRSTLWTLRVLLLGLSLILSLAAAEWLARRAESWSHLDATAADYGDTWAPSPTLGPGGFLKPSFEGQVVDGLGGTVTWKNNSQGFRNVKEFARQPPTGTLRILSLGDSFAVGYRIGQDHTYSRLLQNWASREMGSTEVLVACTETTFHAHRYLRDYGMAWNPHLVLLEITLGNDIFEDYAVLHPEPVGFSHGLEKLIFPSKHRSPEPSFKWPQSALVRLALGDDPGIGSWYSGQLRLFDPVNGLGLFPKEPPPQIALAYERHFKVLSMLEELFRGSPVGLVIVLAPQRFQVQDRDWSRTVSRYRLRRDHFDLMKPNQLILGECRRLKLTCWDPTSSMKAFHRQRSQDLYLPRGDMHWNPAGHRAFYEALKPHLAPLLRELHQNLDQPAR
ncbi:MAG TPA: hypothetical protein VLV83_05450 [Acidobacteriota bacterium]|nr:hypothetical protein [Acidobacteriota bacterium]